MALVPTIPDALYIGATAVDRVYQGPEQIWGPEASLGDLILSHSPLAYWPMDDAQGTVLRDVSGNGYDLTLGAGSVVAGAAVGDYAGTRLDNALMSNNSFPWPAEFTILGFLHTWSGSDSERAIVGGWDSFLYFNREDYAFIINDVHNPNSALWTDRPSNDGTPWLFATTATTDDAVRFGSQGSLAGSVPLVGQAIAPTTAPVHLGARRSSAGARLSFTGAHFSIIPRPLTPLEVSAIYDAFTTGE